MADSENNCNEPPHFICIWTIENVNLHSFVRSPIFTVKEMEMTRWNITIDTEYFVSDNPHHVILDVWREEEDGGPNAIEIKFELSFLGIDGLPIIEKIAVRKLVKGDYFGFNEFAELQEIFFRRRAQFLPRDTLTIRCRMWRTGTEIAEPETCFARTRLRPIQRSFVWAIKKFSTLRKGEVRKITFPKASTEQLAFNLFVSEYDDGKEWVKITTDFPGHDGWDIIGWHFITLLLLDCEGKVVHFEKRKGDMCFDFRFQNFFEKTKLMDSKSFLLPNDVMTLRCEVEALPEIICSVIENYRYLTSTDCGVISTDEGDVLNYEQCETYSLTEAMRSLIKEGTLSDISLQADSKSYPAHKCILGARSPVFKAMFSGDMKEKTDKCVEIPDVDEDTMRELLSYVYTDQVGKLDWQAAANLYRAADKYELLDLKRRCATLLKSDLSGDSVCVVLSLADLHQDLKLREASQDFLMMQGEEFFRSDEWRNFKEENSQLAADVLEQIFCKVN